MVRNNTRDSYGSLTRTLHWFTAFAVFVAFPLGFIANTLLQSPSASLTQVFTLFSAHKTVGIVAFALGLARVIVALRQVRTDPIRTHRFWELWFARLVHWALYAALLVVPLSGWLTHASSEGFAPIFWPLGQGLPFVPRSEALVETFAGIHNASTKFLALLVLLHLAGAIKHSLIDQDETLRRMTLGVATETRPLPAAVIALVTAMALWVAVVVSGALSGSGQSSSVVGDQVEWQIERTSIVLVDAGTERSMDVDLSARLSIPANTQRRFNGTLDVTILLDNAEDSSALLLMDATDAFLIQLLGVISGSNNNGTVTGDVDFGSSTSPVSCEVALSNSGGVIACSVNVPESELSVKFELQAVRP